MLKHTCILRILPDPCMEILVYHTTGQLWGFILSRNDVKSSSFSWPCSVVIEVSYRVCVMINWTIMADEPMSRHSVQKGEGGEGNCVGPKSTAASWIMH